jgi:hypothetical protein
MTGFRVMYLYPLLVRGQSELQEQLMKHHYHDRIQGDGSLPFPFMFVPLSKEIALGKDLTALDPRWEHHRPDMSLFSARMLQD